MTPDQLKALADRLRDHAAMHDSVVPNDDDLIAAAKYLRKCAEAEPVATVRVHNTGGNAGIAWSGVPTEHAGTMRGGTPLYTNPQPQQAGVPEGWKLVPVEPTVEMRRAGTAANDGIVSDIYRAMLAAAPQPPSAQDDAIEALREVARIAHDGGGNLGFGEALVAIRKLTLPFWTRRAVLAAQGVKDDRR